MNEMDILDYAKKFREGLFEGKDGDGLCFAVSAPLAGALRFCGVKCRLANFQVNGFQKFEEHYAIILSDGKLLDPTFDQIEEGNEKVYLGKCPENYIEI